MEELLLTLKHDHVSVVDHVGSPVLVPSGNHLVGNESIQESRFESDGRVGLPATMQGLAL